jgi:hypothetical protein
VPPRRPGALRRLGRERRAGRPPWPTPHWQITAVSEDQTDNVWRALQPMIELGALAADIPDTGKTRINLPGGGLIEPVTSRAESRLGQRITGAPCRTRPRAHRANGGRGVADNQRRNLAGMGGRFIETPNAWDPSRTRSRSRPTRTTSPASTSTTSSPASTSVREHERDCAPRSSASTATRGGSTSTASTTRSSRCSQARPRAGRALVPQPNETGEARPSTPRSGKRSRATRESRAGDELIVIGVDGARFDDALAIVATDVETGTSGRSASGSARAAPTTTSTTTTRSTAR